MTNSPETGKVSWKRFGFAMVPAAIVVGVLGYATAAGAITSSFAISGSSFRVTADEIVGEDFVQYGAVIDPAGQKNVPVAVSGFGHATIKNMCQTVSLGPITMKLTAGNKDRLVDAKNLVLDVANLGAGTATFKNIDIGVDASKPRKGSPSASETPGMFGQQAESVVLKNVDQTAWTTVASEFTLPDLKLGFGGSCG